MRSRSFDPSEPPPSPWLSPSRPRRERGGEDRDEGSFPSDPATTQHTVPGLAVFALGAVFAFGAVFALGAVFILGAAIGGSGDGSDRLLSTPSTSTTALPPASASAARAPGSSSTSSPT